MDFHDDPLETETVIVKYLNRTLDPDTVERFTSHYLECDQCFAELRASEMLMAGLRSGRVDRKIIGDVAVFQVDSVGSVAGDRREFRDLCRTVLEQKDTKVLIDLSRFTRIDSSGLGMLMQCYSHIIRNRGMLKVVSPNPLVRRALSITKMDSLIEAYPSENEALRAFHQAASGQSES
jgi:anti-sigma B factor antagonist